MRIAFFMGSPDISGGSYVIFQHALFLQQAGHDVSVICQQAWTPQQLTWHPAATALPLVHIDALPAGQRFDLAIATWWKTALELHRIDAARYGYFVQSIESRFYPEDERPLRALVDSTYALGLPGVTEATWIRDYLASRHGQTYSLVRNGIRKDIYTREGERAQPTLPSGGLRVLVEGPLGVFFKNVERTITLSREAAPDDLWLLTSSNVSSVRHVDRVFSRVSIDKTAQIYRSCDVLVKLSYVEGMFGPPLEMFHCGGTAIVYDVTGHDEYIRHGENGLVIPRDDEAGVVDALRSLRADPDRLRQLREGARRTADAWPDWLASSTQFEQAVRAMMNAPRVERDALRERNALATRQYEQAEETRLADMPGKRAEQKLRRLVRYLPPGVVYRLKKLRDTFHAWRPR